MEIREVDYVFCRLLDDLCKQIYLPDAWEVVKISRIIRQLLIDKTRIVDQVKRGYRSFREEYVIAMGEPIPTVVSKKIIFHCVLDGLDSNELPLGYSLRSVRRDIFLKAVVMGTPSYSFTIYDVITYLANYKAGVHYSEPEDAKEKSFFEMASFVTDMNNIPFTIYQLNSIGKVVLKTLTPLRRMIFNDNWLPRIRVPKLPQIVFCRLEVGEKKEEETQ